jgi:hypothetical protein
MIRMVVHEREYGNLKDGSADLKQMEEFCLGIQSHMTSMPFEIVPNVRFNNSSSAVLCGSMCLICLRFFCVDPASLLVHSCDANVLG